MWVRHVPDDDADGELRASYDRQARALGVPTEVITSPDTPKAWHR